MSPLQAQYPLSPRKFWKKMVSTVFTWLVLMVIFGLVAGFLISTQLYRSALDQAPNPLLNPGTTLPLPGSTRSEGLAIGFTIGLVAWLIIVILYSIYVRVYIRRYYYDAGDNFVTIKKGVFAPAEIHVMYQKIQDVYVDQDILDRVMGLYDVHIASATVSSGMEAHIDGVEHEAAEGLKTLLLAKIQGGGAPQAMAAGGPPAAPQAPSTVTLSEDVSSKTYPLAGAWVTQQIVKWFCMSVVYASFISVYIYFPGKNGSPSLSNDFGLSWASTWLPVFLVVFIFHIIYTFLWKSTYSFSFLPEYIQMKSGVVSRSEVHVPYRAVQDVRVTQGVIERLFGLSTVNIENAAQAQMAGRTRVKTGVQIPGQSLTSANHIAEVVRSVTLTKNTAQTGL